MNSNETFVFEQGELQSAELTKLSFPIKFTLRSDQEKIVGKIKNKVSKARKECKYSMDLPEIQIDLLELAQTFDSDQKIFFQNFNKLDSEYRQHVADVKFAKKMLELWFNASKKADKYPTLSPYNSPNFKEAVKRGIDHWLEIDRYGLRPAEKNFRRSKELIMRKLEKSLFIDKEAWFHAVGYSCTHGNFHTDGLESIPLAASRIKLKEKD